MTRANLYCRQMKVNSMQEKLEWGTLGGREINEGTTVKVHGWFGLGRWPWKLDGRQCCRDVAELGLTWSDLTSLLKDEKWKSPSPVWLFATPWTIAHQVPLSMGILQPRTLEWVASPSSRGSFQPKDQTHISCGSCIAGGFFTIGETPGNHMEPIERTV